jgi:hypothetical protein
MICSKIVIYDELQTMMMTMEDDTYCCLKRTLQDFQNGKTLQDLWSETKGMIC